MFHDVIEVTVNGQAKLCRNISKRIQDRLRELSANKTSHIESWERARRGLAQMGFARIAVDSALTFVGFEKAAEKIVELEQRLAHLAADAKPAENNTAAQRAYAETGAELTKTRELLDAAQSMRGQMEEHERRWKSIEKEEMPAVTLQQMDPREMDFT